MTMLFGHAPSQREGCPIYKIKQPFQSAFINIGIGIMTEKRILKKFF